MTEKMIPLSVIDARIKEIQGYGTDHWACYDDHYQILIDELRKILSEK